MMSEHALEKVSDAPIRILYIVTTFEGDERRANIIGLATMITKLLRDDLLFITAVGAARHDDMARLGSQHLIMLVDKARLASLI